MKTELKKKQFRIYGRKKGSKRYSAMDLQSGCLVTNLIYASVFNDIDTAELCLKTLQEEVEGYEFKIEVIR